MFVRSVLVAAALTFAVPALAVDFGSPIKQLDGSVMRTDDKQVLTLDTVVENALLASYPDEQTLSGEEKVKRFKLAVRIHDQRKDPTLTADETALIKKLVAKAYNPLVVGQAWTLLDPASVPK